MRCRITDCRALLAVLMLIVSTLPARSADNVLTLATTTSTENSGLLAHIHPDFRERFGVEIKVVARGTGASLALARAGDADVILVHARDAEEKFVAEGYGVERRDVMYNDFVIIGPASDPAGIRGMENAPAALKKVSKAKELFVSRGDNSGTHIKEQSLWKHSGAPLVKTEKKFLRDGREHTVGWSAPAGDWYRSIGQGMGKTIHYSTETRGYTLADRGTFYAFAMTKPPRTDLVILCEGDPRLHNPYGVIAVNPAKHPHIKHDPAMEYIGWITSPSTQKMIGGYTRGGKTLFFPAATNAD